jgi:hypothetical protein
MSYSSTEGYVPTPFNTVMSEFRTMVNTTFSTSYTEESFVGTNFYKFLYNIAQRTQLNETKTAEIFLKLQEYFNEINARILRPSVTPNGLIDALGEAGYLASVKPMIEADAGKLSVCVDVDDAADDYAAMKLEIATIIKDTTVAGVITDGTESELLTLSNTQQFEFSYHLPDRITTYLRLTLTLSRNNQSFIESPETVKERLLANITELYNLGKDFEPERYFTSADAPWASDIKLEYSFDELAWEVDVFQAEFDELLTISLENIDLVEE